MEKPNEEISDIFLKKNDIQKINKNIKFSKNDILESIPKESVKKENIESSKIKTEFRWRIFKIPNKKNEIIEITYKKPNETRKYINNMGDWVEFKLDKKYDEYIIDVFYHYE